MEKKITEELNQFLSTSHIINPVIKVHSEQLSFSSSVLNYNTVTDLLLLIIGFFIFSKVNFSTNIAMAIILSLIIVSSSWYNFMAINHVIINFATKTIMVKSRNPIKRIWLKITTKQDYTTLHFEKLENFYNQPTLYLPSFRRYRLNFKLKKGNIFVLIDFTDEKYSKRIAFYLNKLVLNRISRE
ncbi:hypothetical protein [Chitinophaga japonensis]|uniref:PH (Pleckstrin Homology) domain-containing protein n=1 Tax=Chitinophaga japonensis TaxID=104662 RepID=A0A562T0T2_CHIJA|nr:hypothetical protein [Chitinophaga japonensis]TWI86590.1 hypothetical protein LX66_3849 [Chitinophaga japonensis]